MYDERVCAECRNDSYYAHLSIYHFASSWCRGKTVLDAGCGTGYGSAYLAEHGALSVCAVDGDPEAIAFCKKQFPRENLKFEVADLRRISLFPDQHFDVIFASNSLEHVEGVDAFFRTAWRLLKLNGVMIVAVPGARDRSDVVFELSNPHHVNIWSPDHWWNTQKRYFETVRCFTHFLTEPSARLTPGNLPDETVIRETDFTFQESPVSELYSRLTISAIFVSNDPVPEQKLPHPGPLELRDHSISRKVRSSWMHPFQWAYHKIFYIVRYQGIMALPARTLGFVRRRFRKK